MVKSPSVAKISRPVLTGIHHRKRLFRKLDGAREKPVIWVSGPAGSGKTTLVSSYIESRKLPSIWYQLDEGDSDPATFFYYMGLAGKKAAPRRKKPLPLLTPEYMLGLPTFSKRFFEDLCGRFRGPSVIVLDNYQEVPLPSALHGALAAGFNVVPGGVNIIILSRQAHPKAFARLLASNMIATVGWENLRLTESESRALARIHGGANLSKEACERLHERTAGWAAGLVLLLKSGEADDVYRGRESEAFGEVFNYFAGEIFDRTEAGTRNFLLKTAFLPSMSVKMAGAISGSEKAGSVLQSLYHHNYFTSRQPGSVLVYQFHPLFREFLLARGRNVFSENEAADLEKNAARILEEAGRYEEAGELFIEAQDWQSLVLLILNQAPTLSRQGRFAVLEAWLRNLPEELLGSMPWLLYWMGLCRLPFDQEESERHFERAFDAFFDSGDGAGAFLSWSGVVDSIMYGFNDFKRVDQWIPRLDAVIERFGQYPSEDIEGRVVASIIVALANRNPRHQDIDRWSERVLTLKEKDMDARVQGLFTLMYIRLSRADVAGAGYIYESLKALERKHDLSPLAMLNVRMAKALYYNLVGRYSECLETVREAIAFAARTGVHVMDFMLLGNGVMSALSGEDEGEAEKLLEEMALRIHTARTWDLSFYYFLLAWQALLKDDLAAARGHSDVALKLATQVGSFFSIGLNYSLKAHIMHASGEAEEAVESLARVDRIARRMKMPLFAFMCHLTHAEFMLDRGDQDAAVGHIQKAMTIGKKEGLVTTYFIWRQAMERICAVALEADIEVEYVRDLIRKVGLVPESLPLHIERWPWEIRIFTMGGFGLEKGGERVTFSGKVKQRPLLFLKALVSLGGREVRKERITDLLWPDADADVANKSFATTLHRLRKLLGREDALLLRRERVSLNPRRIWLDVWAFERLVEMMDAAFGEASDDAGPDHVVKLCERAIALYPGPFLPMETERLWTARLRERLRSKFLRCVERLGSNYESAREWEKAVHCYRRGLEVDELAEEFLFRLMSCYHKLGRRAEALATYERCRETLNAVLGIDPSPKTEELYRALAPGSMKETAFDRMEDG